MAHAAPLPLSVVNLTVARPSADARFGLDSLVSSGPRDSRAHRAVAPSVLSFAAHVVIVAAVVVLPLVLGEISLPAASDAVHAFFVPPPEVALPPPPPPPPAAARALTPAPTAPRPVAEASFPRAHRDAGERAARGERRLRRRRRGTGRGRGRRSRRRRGRGRGGSAGRTACARRGCPRARGRVGPRPEAAEQGDARVPGNRGEREDVRAAGPRSDRQRRTDGSRR